MKRPPSDKILRHLTAVIVSLLMVLLFMALRPGWSPPMHVQNKAFADASLILIVVVLFMGACARLRPSLRKWLTWQREFGIWAMVLALVHVYIVFVGWSEGSVSLSIGELFGFRIHSGAGQWVFADAGISIANVVGLLALIYGLALLVTSNDLSVRLLTLPSWRYLHQRAVELLYVLVVVHTAYFLYFYYQTFPKSPPPSNFFRIVFPVLIVGLIALRAAAFVKTVRYNRRSGNG
jgi:sulfoxide reductase heme-binding subunit YedZ